MKSSISTTLKPGQLAMIFGTKVVYDLPGRITTAYHQGNTFTGFPVCISLQVGVGSLWEAHLTIEQAGQIERALRRYRMRGESIPNHQRDQYDA